MKLHDHHSLDLTQCDFLWGFLKAEVIKRPTKNPLGLIQVIQTEIQGIPPPQDMPGEDPQVKFLKLKKNSYMTEKVIKNKLFVKTLALFIFKAWKVVLPHPT